MTPDPAQLRHWVDEIIPNVTLPGDGRPGAPDGRRAPVTRRVALIGKPLRRRHSQVMHDAAFDAAGIDARYVLLELEPEAVEAAVAEARGPDWLGLGVTAPYKRVVAGLVDEVEADAAAIGAVNNVVRRDDGPLRRLQHRRAGVPRRGRARDGPAARGRRGRRRRGGRRGPRGRVRLPVAPAPPRVTVGNRTVAAAAGSPGGSTASGQGRSRASRSAGAAFTAALAAADLAVNATTVGMLDPGVTIDVGAPPVGRDGLRPRLRAGRDAAPARGASARPARRERLRDAHRPGGDRVRALDRRRRHGRRHARGRRAAPRRRDRPGLTDASRHRRPGRCTSGGRASPAIGSSPSSDQRR